MKKYFLFISIFILFSCKKERVYTLKDIQGINGFWFISDVLFPDGTDKQYKLGDTIDYFELDSLKGFRKKVYPRIDGKFESSDDVLDFYIIKKASKGFFINYYNGEMAWQEAIIFIESNRFFLENSEGVIYCYQRYKQFDVLEDGKKTK